MLRAECKFSCTKVCKLKQVFGVQKVSCTMHLACKRFRNFKLSHTKKSFRVRCKGSVHDAKLRAKSFELANFRTPKKSFRARCIWRAKSFELAKFHTQEKFSCTMHLARKKFRTCKLSHTRKVFVHDAFGVQNVLARHVIFGHESLRTQTKFLACKMLRRNV